MSFFNDKMQLPSIRALRSVEAVVRLGSFTKAAEELNVTQGAISRQIQELESQLAVELFLRKGPKIVVTDTGRDFAQMASEALNMISVAVLAAKQKELGQFVTLSMLPSVASKWLAPRLGKFIDNCPDIDLRVAASRNLVNFDQDGIDATVRYGKGQWSGLDASMLSEEVIFPVCSPVYALSIGLDKPEQLLRATLFHADIEEDWAAWFAKAGVTVRDMPRGPRLGDDAAILQAAIDGQGVALGRSLLVGDDLKTGRLIAPFQTVLKASYSYWFVTPSEREVSPMVTRVKEWIEAEISQAHVSFGV